MLNSDFLKRVKEKIGWDTWENWHPHTQTVVKLFPLILILFAIPITVGFLQTQQNLSQEAKSCHGGNIYCGGSPTPTPTATSAQSACITSATSFQSRAIPIQTGIFEINFDITPNTNFTDADTGLSNISANAYTDMAAIVEFNSSGYITARNGVNYTAISNIPYSAGTTYHIRLDINIPNHLYSAYVTPAGGTEKTIGNNFAFRAEQQSITSLSYLSLVDSRGTHTVCNISVPATTSPTPTPKPTATPTPTISSQKVVQFTPSETISQFITLTKDMTVDAIEMTAGTYAWDSVAVDVDRTARPLTIRPANGATVTFTSNGSPVYDGVFLFGYNATPKWITMDGVTQGGFTFDGQLLSQAGVLGLGGSDHLTFKNMTFKNLRRGATSDKPYKSWVAYISSIGGRSNNHLLIDHLTLLAPAVYRDVSAIQVASNAVGHGAITISNISMINYDYAFYADVPIVNLVLDTWSMTNIGNSPTPASIRFTPVNINGTYKNLHATLSDPLYNSSTGIMVNGGGNSGL